MAKAATARKQIEARDIEAPPAPARPLRLPVLLLLVDNDKLHEPMPWHHELLEQKRYDEAFAACDEMLARGEGRPGFIECVRALAFWELGQHETALKTIDHAIALEPKRAVSHIIRGYPLLAMGRIDEAWLAAEQALKVEPHNATAYLNATSVFMLRSADVDYPFKISRDDLNQALQLIERAVALDTDPGTALALRGKILFQLDRFEEAISSLNEARAHGHDYHEDMRADALFELGRPEEAVQIYEKLLADEERIALLGTTLSYDGATYESKLARYREALADLALEEEHKNNVIATNSVAYNEAMNTATAYAIVARDLGIPVSDLKKLRPKAAKAKQRGKAKVRGEAKTELTAARLKATYEILVRESDLANPTLSTEERMSRAIHLRKTYYRLRKLDPSFEDTNEQLRLATKLLNSRAYQRRKAATLAAERIP